MANKPYYGVNPAYNSNQTNEMVMGLPGAMTKATVNMLKKVKTGLGNAWDSMDTTSKAATVAGLVPGIGQVGDIAGLADDARLFYQNPEMRTPANFGMSALGLLPLIPSMGMVKGVGKGIAGSIVPSMPTVPKEPEQIGMIADDVLAQGNKQIQEMEGLVPPVQRVAPQDEALRLAQERAALPVEQGGLGLPVDNTPEQRAMAQNSVDYLHGTERLDRLLSGKNLDPKRATSGPMPFGTDSESIASTYAMNKRDTSRMDSDAGDFGQYFQVSPKSLGYRGKIPYSVEKSWYHLSPEVKADILDKSRRIGYKDPKTGEGDWTLHPTSDGLPVSPSHYDYELKNAGGNPLVALRRIYAESGMLDAYAPSELADIYKLAGYPHEISQANAPWTEAKGVFTGKAMLDKPLKTSNIEEIQNIVIPALKKAFEKDRTKTKVSNSDAWSKNSRFTPKQWVNELEKDIAEGNNSYVWTSIPDKVTEQLKKLNYTGIIDTGGKGGGMNEGHQVVIPFNPDDVRSRFAAFDPFRRSAAIAAAMGVAAPDLMADEKQKPAKKNIVPPVKKQGK